MTARIILIILAIATIATGVFWWRSSNQTPQIACTMEAKLCPDGSYVGRSGPKCEFAPCPSSKDEMANWKTYTNDRFGFSLKYPANQTFKTDRSTSQEKPMVDFYDENKRAPELLWNLYVLKAPLEKSLSDLIGGQNNSDSRYYQYQVTSQEPIQIDPRHNGYVVKTKDEGGFHTTVLILVDSANTVVMQSLSFDPRIFDQILSTFKFLDPNQDPGIKCQQLGGKWLASYKECEIDQSGCDQLGGQFEPCGSACRHDPSAYMCTQQCVYVCKL